MNVMRLWKGALVVALMGTVLAFAGTTMAATIVQGATDDYLAFEVEDFDSLIDHGSDGINWTVIGDAGASGLQAAQASSVLDTTFGNEGELVYNLEFTKPTAGYRVYIRFKNLGSSNHDSILLPQNWLNTPGSPDPTSRTGTLGRDAATIGTYYWASLGPAGTVTAGTYDFRIGIRESLAEIDRIVFADQTFLNTTGRLQVITSGTGLTLDGLANSAIVPEPASLGLLALGMLAVGGMRRRQG